jgi:hypothetical protein
MWAFSDESERGSRMLLGLLVLPAGELAPARRALRGLLLPGQRRVHTAKESPRRRRELLDVVMGLELSAMVFELRRPARVHRVAGRERLLRAACGEVLARSVVMWTLDDQEPAHAARDRRTIEQSVSAQHGPLAYDHRPARDELLLWAIDAIVWAVGARGAWAANVRSVEVRAIEP